MSVSPLSRTDDIDPDVRSFIERTGADFAALSAVAPPTNISRRREIAEQVRAPWSKGGPDMAETRMVQIGRDGVRARIHIPASGAGKGTLLYLHGGGWMLFSIDTHDRLMREYAQRIGCAVVGLDYSLSPEHRFPRALEDVDACIHWLRSEGAGHGLSVDRLAIGGDSAGGNLSLAAALRLRDRSDALPAALLLNYAALDTEPSPSYKRYDGAPYMLNVDEMRDFWVNYLGKPTTDDPYARPLLADLSGLPPVHLCIAECDILADQNTELADRLETAGVEVSSIVYKGATHSFLEAVSISDCADRAIQDASDWLAKILNA
ncbi:MAG: alpha/beta hydrolase [Alphaproteobacteria bacterium HGW-Alphaproteobacteria-18]|nr:MAG: alpha/beta hydrolase [Alphaproteobacteria bacterium HGW-Alphaproteobacteria-18]